MACINTADEQFCDADGRSEDCPKSKDGDGHCRHWWDCEPCCWCGDDCPECAKLRADTAAEDVVGG